MKKVSIVIPAHNEQENLPLLFEKITKACRGQGIESEMVFVNDGSTDRTAEIARGFESRMASLRIMQFGH